MTAGFSAGCLASKEDQRFRPRRQCTYGGTTCTCPGMLLRAAGGLRRPAHPHGQDPVYRNTGSAARGAPQGSKAGPSPVRPCPRGRKTWPGCPPWPARPAGRGLATDKVRFQGQEGGVRGGRGPLRGPRGRASSLIDVGSTSRCPLWPTGPGRALDADAPAGSARRPRRATRANHIFDWESGDAGTYRTGSSATPTGHGQARTCSNPRVHPAPLETCGQSWRTFNRVSGKLMTVSGPPARPPRNAPPEPCTAIVGGAAPKHKIRGDLARDPSAGRVSATRCRSTPGYLWRESTGLDDHRPAR